MPADILLASITTYVTYARFLLLTLLSSTASMMTIALMTICGYDGTFIRLMILPIRAITKIPTTVITTVPSPPERLAPPITTPAIVDIW